MKRLILGGILVMVIMSSIALAEIQKDKPDAAINKKVKELNEKIDVIITLKDKASDINIEKIKNKVADIKINEQGWDNVYPNGFAATITKKQMRELSKDPSVERIDKDEMQTIALETANKWFGTTKARAASPTGFGVDGDRTGNVNIYSKTDVVIAILDTGIDPKHKDLTGEDNGGNKKILAWKDTINGIASPYDDHGHGTHVASIAAGDGSADSRFKGVAPGAALVGVKVCNSGGSCPSSKIIAGINWVVANKATFGIKIMSLSLGGFGAADGTDPESVAVNNAVDAGIVATIAAGNAGPLKYTISSPGVADKAITVGNMADPGTITGVLPAGQLPLADNGFYLAPSSSRGPTASNKIKPDIVAPGVNIRAASNVFPNSALLHGGYVEKTGTSMSTPFVAGVVALMFDANYLLTPDQIKNMIRSTAEDYGVAGCDIDYGCGRLRAYKAIGFAKTGAIPAGDQIVPTHNRFQRLISDSTPFKSFPVTITAPNSIPYSSTLIMTDWSGIVPSIPSAPIDLDLFVNNPGGFEIGDSQGVLRQETVVVRPSSTGSYSTVVDNFLGGGFYTLDISYK